MRKLLRGLARPSTLIPVFMIPVSFYAATNFFDRDTLQVIINGLCVAGGIAVWMAYAPVLYRSLRAENPSVDQFLVTGILMCWGSAMGSRAWALAYLVLQKPAWMQSHWVPYLFFVFFASSSLYFVSMPTRKVSAKKVEIGWTYPMMIAVMTVLIAVGVLAYVQADPEIVQELLKK